MSALSGDLGPDIYMDESPMIVDIFVTGTPEEDALVGDECTESIYGEDFCSSSISGLAGDDLLMGDKGPDSLSGDEGDDLLWGGGSSDRLRGGIGKDRLWGAKGNDNLQGGDDNDKLRGGQGDDFLRGDWGRDRLWGGEGVDVFILQPGQGVDRIMDYQDGEDRLGLDSRTQLGNLSVVQRNRKAVIFHNDDRLAVLVNVDADTITASDFGRIAVVA